MNAGPLPQDASPASVARYDLARQVAERCPQALGVEIALTGSASRGVADDDSDIELNLWCDAMPPQEERERWLREMEAEPLEDSGVGADGTRWTICFISGVQFEVGWQAFDRQRSLVQELVATNILDHRRLIVADTLVHAVPLRSEGILGEWQAQLRSYPAALRDRLIEGAVKRWTWPPLQGALARRGESVTLASRLVDDVEAVLRCLFALNLEWEPDWKWLRFSTQRLRLRPGRLVERVDEVFSTSGRTAAVRLCFELVLDTLRLLPNDAQVSRAKDVIEGSLNDIATRP